MRWPKTPKPGDPITAEWGAAVVEVLSKVVRPRPPLRFEQSRNGIELIVDATDAGPLTCKSPPGGIAPGATALCYRYKLGTHDELTASQVPITNPGPDTVPGDRKVWYGTSNGVPRSALWWSCSPVS